MLRRLPEKHRCYFCVLWCCSQLKFSYASTVAQMVMVRTVVHVVIDVAMVVLLQLAVVLVMASSSGVPDEYLPSDQFNKGSFFVDRRGLGSLCVASITDHPNSTTVPHEHVWMSIQGCGGLANCFCTRLVNLIWLGIVVMGTFTWRRRRWTPPHVFILIVTVTAAVASLFFAIANVAALFTACVGLIMLVANWHFGLLVCAALSLPYWCSALWIGWTMSPLVGVALGVLAVAMRRSFLLFSKKITIVYNGRTGSDETRDWLWSKSVEQFKEQARKFFSVDKMDELFFSIVGGEDNSVVLDPDEPFPDTETRTFRLEVVAGTRSSPHPPLPSCIVFLHSNLVLLSRTCPVHVPPLPSNPAPSVLTIFVRTYPSLAPVP